jgi:hypothetical protein
MKQTEDKGKCLCGGCGKRFWRLSTFDRHRVGPFSDRRCLEPAEMQDRGFTQDSKGYWRPPPRKDAEGNIIVRKAPHWAKGETA